MKVTLLKTVAGPEINANAGATIEVSDKFAKDLIADGAAQPVDPKGPVETATAAPQRKNKS
jgi:hypothetical protein